MQSKGGNIMKRRSGMNIMGQLIGLVRPLLHVMLAAILLGAVSYTHLTLPTIRLV